jgi:hypothetical protein
MKKKRAMAQTKWFSMQDHVSKFHQADSLVVILTDFAYFLDTEALDEWCWQTFEYHPRTGTVLTFREPSHTTLFVLKWK